MIGALVDRIRGVGRLVSDLGWYVVRTGRWWVPLLIVAMAVAAVIALVVKAAVPTAVYVLF